MMAENSSFLQATWKDRIFGTEQSIQRIPWLNDVITVYVGVLLLTHTLLTIAPFLTFLSQTPLYHIRSWLGVFGGVLLAADLFTNRGLWRGPWCVLLYGVCLMAGVASLRTIQYGVKYNLFDLCWVIIQFALVYSWAYRLDRPKIRRFFRILYPICLTIWFVACCVSLYQYAMQIGYCYVADPLSDNPELTRQGFWGYRLFGVFMSMDYAVYVSLALDIVGVYFFEQTKRLRKKIVLSVMMFTLLMHIILSGSRSVFLAWFLYVFFFTYLRGRSRMSTHEFRRLTAQMWVVLLCVACFFGLKYAAQYIPVICKSGPRVELSRQGLEGDISNSRFDIWKDYISISDDIGLTGLSLANYNDYIKEHHSDLYIVRYFQDTLGDVAKKDLVYECHNSYLFVFVSTGLIGFLLFAAFLVLLAIRILRYIKAQKNLSPDFIAALAVVCIGCVEAMFMNSVFLKINAPSFGFWIALGYLMWIMEHSASDSMASAS